VTPAALLERVEALRKRTAQTLAELREIIPALPADDGVDRPDGHPTETMSAARGELDFAADLLEDVIDYFSERGDEETEDDRNCCAWRAVRSLAVTKGSAK
jgi:hypothetical protein